MASAVREQSGDTDQRIVLLGGAMRSGTTVIHRALCTARNANPYLAESWFLRDIIRLYRMSLNRYELRYADQLGRVNNFNQLIRMNVHYYVNMVSARYGDPDIFFFKHPELIKHFVEFARLFPRMLFIAIVRDPRDVLSSMKRIRDKNVSDNVKSPVSDLTTTEDMCRYYADYYERVLANRKKLGRRLQFVRYEDVMRNPQEVIGKIGKFSGAEYDLDEVPNFNEERSNSRYFDKELRMKDPVSSAFWSDLYTKDFSQERIGKYDDTLSKDEVKEVEERLAVLGKAFGYW